MTGPRPAPPGRLPIGPLALGLVAVAMAAAAGGMWLYLTVGREEVPPLTVLEVPVDCEPGRNCFIQNYVDRDPGPGYRDYACGRLSIDGHKGTDIRLGNLAEMAAGVRVLAAAPGLVRAVRDGMPDVSVKQAGPAAVKGREAGNSVVIRHGDGWETQYSHLRRGSVAVAPGDRVAAGLPLGLVGLSGNTEFPHLHLELRHRGQPVDPFTGPAGEASCGDTTGALWSPAALGRLAYVASGLLGAGFAAGEPAAAAVRRGEHRPTRLSADAPALVFWVDFFGALESDRLLIRLLAPDGSVLAETGHRFRRSKAQYFRFVGKRRRADPWPPGAYRGKFVLIRPDDGGGRRVLDVTRTLRVE